MGIKLENICKQYQKPVLSHFSAELPERGLVVLTGPSGCGKTTLAHILLGLVKPDGGHVSGTDGVRFSVVFQEDRLLESLTAAENINAVCKQKLHDEQISTLLSGVGLKEAFSRRPGEMSGGMRRRLAFARAVAFDGDVFVLDEPFAGLDSAAKELVTAHIVTISTAKPVVLIVHNALPFAETAVQIITV